MTEAEEVGAEAGGPEVGEGEGVGEVGVVDCAFGVGREVGGD